MLTLVLEGLVLLLLVVGVLAYLGNEVGGAGFWTNVGWIAWGFSRWALLIGLGASFIYLAVDFVIRLLKVV